MRARLGVFVAMLLAGLLAAGCDDAATANGPNQKRSSHNGSDQDAEATNVVVTIPPLAWAVRGLASPEASVRVLVGTGSSPHGFELTPAQVAAVARADLVVMAGAGLEPGVDRVLRAHPSASRRVLRFESLVEEAERLENACDHEHHGAHEHHHPTDPHFWLDPVLMERFVTALADEPGMGGPDAAAALAEACRSIDMAYVEGLAAVPRRSLIVQHAAYGYLCARYGLSVAGVLRPIESVEPTPGDLIAAKRLIEAERVPAIFIEPQFPAGAARRLAESTGVELLTLDPLGDGDWPGLMRANLEALTAGLGATVEPRRP